MIERLRPVCFRGCGGGPVNRRIRRIPKQLASCRWIACYHEAYQVDEDGTEECCGYRFAIFGVLC
jgi:hypothetical protein